MTDKDKGFSRMGRVVAVIGISLGLVVVSTTPSQAFAPSVAPLLASALPSTVIPASTIGVLGATGTAAGATVCAATVYCGLAVVAGILLTVGGTGLVWQYKGRPNTDVVDEGSVNWVTYPYKDPFNPEVVASYRFGNRPNALKEYPGTDNVQHCVIVQSKTDPENIQLTNCNGAGTFVEDAIRPGATSKYRVIYNQNTWNAIGFAVRLWVGGSVSAKVWEIAISSPLANTNYEVPTALQPNPQTIPPQADPDRHIEFETECTRPDGTKYTVKTYSSVYKHGDASRPELTPGVCTQGGNPTGFKATEERETEPGVFTPSTFENPIPGAPGVILTADLPDAVTDPSYEFAECITGSIQCNIQIGKVKPDGTVETCDIADCSDVAQWVRPDAPTENNPYRCTYNGVVVAQSECTPLVPDIEAITKPAPTPNTESCGLSISCWAA